MRISEIGREWFARLAIMVLVGVALGGCSSGTTSDAAPTEAASEPLSPTEAVSESTAEPTAGLSAASTFDEGNAAELADMIVVNSPMPAETVASPLEVTGEARGMWFFEADFPVRLEDATGNVVGEGFATAEGEWMTEEFVPFSATIEFEAPYEPGLGQLVLSRDNPAGLPENDQELVVPVVLE